MPPRPLHRIRAMYEYDLFRDKLFHTSTKYMYNHIRDNLFHTPKNTMTKNGTLVTGFLCCGLAVGCFAVLTTTVLLCLRRKKTAATCATTAIGAVPVQPLWALAMQAFCGCLDKCIGGFIVGLVEDTCQCYGDEVPLPTDNKLKGNRSEGPSLSGPPVAKWPGTSARLPITR